VTQTRRRPAQNVSTLRLQDFSGGLNLRDAPLELAPNESPDMWNVTIDERGGAVKRLGSVKLNTPAVNAKNIFYSVALGLFFYQNGTQVLKTTNWGTVTGHMGFSTAATVGFADFGGEVVVVHPVDGVFTTDGTTATNRSTTAKGSAVAVWQNKVWVADGNRVWWSNANDAHTWTTATDWIRVREGGDDPITALGGGQGMDVSGRGGLLVYKAEAVHRINNSTTGSYSAMSFEAGAGGPLAVTALHGQTLSVNKRGVWISDGVNTPARVSDKIQTHFHPDKLNFSQLSLIACGTYRDRFVFALPWGTSATSNTILWEYGPRGGWFVPHSLAMACFTTNLSSDQRLYAGGSAGNVFDLFRGGSDNGTSILSRFQTRWFEPNGSYRVRIRRCRVQGRGSFNLSVYKDFASSPATWDNVMLATGGTNWNAANWNAFTWGPIGYADYQDFPSFGVARAFSFQVAEASTTAKTTPSELVSGPSTETGAWGLYGLTLDYINLGLA
jgi:hypothetical protein